MNPNINKISSQREESLVNTVGVVNIPASVVIAISAILSNPTTSKAWDIETLRTIWDIGQFVPLIIAGKCAHDKQKLPNFVGEATTAIALSHLSKAITWNEWIWKRPNGWDEPWFPSSHTTASVAWFTGTLKYCDEDFYKIVSGTVAWITAYSRFAKDDNGRAPHTPEQVAAGVALPFILEMSGFNDIIEKQVSKILKVPEEDVSLSAWGFMNDGGNKVFGLEVKF